MSAGDKVSSWFDNLGLVKDIRNYLTGVKRRFGEFKQLNKQTSPLLKAILPLYISVLSVVYIAYVILDIGTISDYSILSGRVKVNDKLSEEIGKSLREAAQDPAIRELMQVVGGLAYDPFAGMLNQYGSKDSINTQEFLRQFYGALILLPILGNMVNMAGQAATGGFIKNLGKPIEEAYFTLGLGFIGWQGLSPLLSESVLAAVTREAKRTFRQTRFKSGDLLDQYIREVVPLDDVYQGLRDEGWRGDDIRTILKMSRKPLSRSEIDKLFALNQLNEEDYRKQLRRLGYEDEAINWIVYLERQEKVKEAKPTSKTTAARLFKNGLMIEADFRNILRALNLDNSAIDLEIKLIRFEQDSEIKEISVGQLSSAFDQNVINRVEARKALKDLGYQDENVNLIVETWEKKKAPKVIKLNQSSITNAVARGILSPAQGFNKLRELGYNEKDTEIILDSIRVEKQVTLKTPSEAVIIRAFQHNLISRNEALERLNTKGYRIEDSELILRLASTSEAIAPDVNDILEAYLYSVMDRNQAENALRTLGATDNFIALRLDTTEKRRARLKVQFNASQVGKWFRQALIDQNQALIKLGNLGYSREDSLIFLESVSTSEPAPLSDSGISDALVTGVIDETKALALFRELGLSQENAQIRIETIQRETGIVKAKVSIATLLSATRDGILDSEQLKERLVNLGLDERDVLLYLAIAEQRNTNVETKLTKADIMRGYKLGRLNDAEALALLESKGYSLEEAGYLLSLELRDIELSDTFQDILNGALSPDVGIEQLLAQGYSLKEITDALESLGA